MKTTVGMTNRKSRVRLGLAALVVPVAVLIPTMAYAGAGQDDLAEVRQVTAQFHSVDAAIAAGYELGYVNGAGQRIITGCIAHPTAGAMGYHYFNKALIDDLVVDVSKPEGLVYAPGSGREPQARVRGVRRPGPELEPTWCLRTAFRARDADAHPRPSGWLLHPACLGLGS